MVKNEKTKLRRQYILEMARKIGLYNINRKEVAKKFDVTEQQIFKDFQKIYKEGIDKDILKKATLNLNELSLAQIEKLHRTLALCKNPKEISTISKAIDSAKNSYTDFLEKYGKKQRIAEKHEVKGDLPIAINIIPPNLDNSEKNLNNQENNNQNEE